MDRKGRMDELMDGYMDICIERCSRKGKNVSVKVGGWARELNGQINEEDEERNEV